MGAAPLLLFSCTPATIGFAPTIDAGCGVIGRSGASRPFLGAPPPPPTGRRCCSRHCTSSTSSDESPPLGEPPDDFPPSGSVNMTELGLPGRTACVVVLVLVLRRMDPDGLEDTLMVVIGEDVVMGEDFVMGEGGEGEEAWLFSVVVVVVVMGIAGVPSMAVNNAS